MPAIRTKDGRLVDPFKLTLDDVWALDFNHALSCINRYTGWAKYPYSVGQHSYVLARHCPPGLRKAALIHDYGEAFFNDLASPVKCEFPDYKHAEEQALRIIAFGYKVPWSDLEEVSRYDKALYIDERDTLFDHINERGMGDDRERLDVDPWFFRERNWKDVYADLTYETLRAFVQG